MKKLQNIHPLIMSNIINWMLVPKKKLSYFGHFLSKMSFYEDHRTKAMKVTPTRTGFKLIYNKQFVENITEPEVRFVLLHEIFHCFNFHLSRLKKYDRNISNYAMDMIVNYQVNNIKYQVNEEIVQPENLILLPTEYNGPIVFESIYEWLVNNKNENQKNYETQQMFQKMEDGEYFDDHFDGDIEDIDIDEIQHNIIKIHTDIVNQNKGDIPGMMKKIIQEIKKRKENPVDRLKGLMSDMAYSSKKKTFRKLNRKGIPGFKGTKKTGMAFNCIADVSGSMRNVLKDAIGVVTNSIFTMNLIKVDAEVKNHEVFAKASDLKKLEFEGGGGTILQPGIDYVTKNKTLRKNGTIIVTDGFIDELDLSKLDTVTIVYTSKKPKIKNKSRKYRELKIEV